MAGPKSKAASKHCKTPNSEGDTTTSELSTIDALRLNADLWYRICALLHDLNSFGSDPQAQQRLASTVSELYISEPYFREHEAIMIRNATNVKNFGAEHHSLLRCNRAPTDTVEQAIHDGLTNFIEKRKASGDARPCGPHDIAPVYAGIFGVSKEEIKDEKFLSRLRRSGVVSASAKLERTATNSEPNTRKSRGGKGKKGTQ